MTIPPRKRSTTVLGPGGNNPTTPKVPTLEKPPPDKPKEPPRTLTPGYNEAVKPETAPPVKRSEAPVSRYKLPELRPFHFKAGDILLDKGPIDTCLLIVAGLVTELDEVEVDQGDGTTSQEWRLHRTITPGRLIGTDFFTKSGYSAFRYVAVKDGEAIPYNDEMLMKGATGAQLSNDPQLVAQLIERQRAVIESLGHEIAVAGQDQHAAHVAREQAVQDWVEAATEADRSRKRINELTAENARILSEATALHEALRKTDRELNETKSLLEKAKSKLQLGRSIVTQCYKERQQFYKIIQNREGSILSLAKKLYDRQAGHDAPRGNPSFERQVIDALVMTMSVVHGMNENMNKSMNDLREEVRGQNRTVSGQLNQLSNQVVELLSLLVRLPREQLTPIAEILTENNDPRMRLVGTSLKTLLGTSPTPPSSNPTN